jgi:hypothetical protein
MRDWARAPLRTACLVGLLSGAVANRGGGRVASGAVANRGVIPCLDLSPEGDEAALGLKESHGARQATWRPMSERRGRTRPCGLLPGGGPRSASPRKRVVGRGGVCSRGGNMMGVRACIAASALSGYIPLTVCHFLFRCCSLRSGRLVVVVQGVPPRGGLDKSSQPAGGLGSRAGWAPNKVYLLWSRDSGLGRSGWR